VADDAAWCGQCFTRLTKDDRAADPPAPAVAAQAPGEPDERAEPFWPCPACGNRNPISVDLCAVCGTPFSQLFRDDEAQRPSVEPKDAVVASLVFPGLGHRKLGRGLDGLARGVLFSVAFLLALLTGFGARNVLVLLVCVVFLVVALGVYALSAYEAYRMAQGGDVLVGSRVLLWTLVLVIFLAVALLALSAVSSTRQ
jgi:hypothetical protein